MQLHFLISSEQRASGAMFMDTLNETVLAFIYPTDGTRTFHTFFCPPMRIVALSADGQVLFEELMGAASDLPVCDRDRAKGGLSPVYSKRPIHCA